MIVGATILNLCTRVRLPASPPKFNFHKENHSHIDGFFGVVWASSLGRRPDEMLCQSSESMLSGEQHGQVGVFGLHLLRSPSHGNAHTNRIANPHAPTE